MKSIFLNIKDFDKIGSYNLYCKLFVKEPGKDVYSFEPIKIDTNIFEYKLYNNDIFCPFPDETELMFAVCDIEKDSNWLNKTPNYVGSSSIIYKKTESSNVCNINLSSYSTNVDNIKNLSISVDSDISVVSGETVDIETLNIESNIKYMFYNAKILNMNINVLEIINDTEQEFDGFTAIKDGSFNLPIKVKFKDSYYSTDIININIDVTKSNNDTEYISMNELEYYYAYFSMLNKSNFKPNIPVALFISNNLELKNINVYVDDVLLNTIETNDSIVNINVSSVEPYVEHELKLEFNVSLNGKNIILSNSQSFVVSDTINANLGVEYDSDTNKHTIKISAEDSVFDNIQNILWKITFDSYVFQNIIDFGGEDGSMKTDIIYDKLVDASNRYIEAEFKQTGKYVIEAYIIDKGGNTTRLQTDVVNGNTTDDNSFKLGSKLSISIVNNTNSTPVVNIYNLSNEDGFKKIDTQPMDNVVDNIYNYSFPAEIDNSIYIVKIGKLVKLFKIGEYSNLSIIYNPSYTEESIIDYELKDVDGKIIDTGTMKYGSEGIMYCIIDPTKHGVLRIGRHYKNV